MADASNARAFCNNEVAFLAWRLPAPTAGCLGFSIDRVITGGPAAANRRTLPAWVGFESQG